jgi:hypothetical protein
MAGKTNLHSVSGKRRNRRSEFFLCSMSDYEIYRELATEVVSGLLLRPFWVGCRSSLCERRPYSLSPPRKSGSCGTSRPNSCSQGSSPGCTGGAVRRRSHQAPLRAYQYPGLPMNVPSVSFHFSTFSRNPCIFRSTDSASRRLCNNHIPTSHQSPSPLAILQPSARLPSPFAECHVLRDCWELRSPAWKAFLAENQ